MDQAYASVGESDNKEIFKLKHIQATIKESLDLLAQFLEEKDHYESIGMVK